MEYHQQVDNEKSSWNPNGVDVGKFRDRMSFRSTCSQENECTSKEVYRTIRQTRNEKKGKAQNLK